jgi:hypothetical protein
VKYFINFSLSQTFNYPVNAMCPQDAIDMIYELPISVIKNLLERNPDFIFHGIEDETGKSFNIEDFDCDY